jgi:hypothetical protein
LFLLVITNRTDVIHSIHNLVHRWLRSHRLR